MKKIMSIVMIILLFTVGFEWNMAHAYGNSPVRFVEIENGENFVSDQIIVKFKNDSKRFRVLKVPKGQVKKMVKEYSKNPNVIYAEPNYYASAFVEPNDTYYEYQWNMRSEEEGGVGAEEAWTTSTGKGVIVAILDSGIAYENYKKFSKAPDLANTNFVDGYDFINNDSHANDDNSHGTHVAGTVAQSTNNGMGVAGVAYEATLMPVKVLSKSGSGSYSAIADGIYFAADNGAQVINMSLGGPYPASILEDALKYAYDSGVTIVAASGNDGTSQISYPAAYDDYVIAVGATRFDRTRSYYSNYGSKLDIMAPGGDTGVDQNGDGYIDGILQNTLNPNSQNVSDFGYWFFQGTSMASPHVAGVAALVIANGNATTPDQVRAALEETAIDLGASGWDNVYGHGLVNAPAALAWSSGPVSNTAPIAEGQTVVTDEDVAVDIVLSGNDAENDPLEYTVLLYPSNGTLSGTAPNVKYTPNNNHSGNDSFTFKVNDGKEDSNIAVVDIIINPVGEPPVEQGQIEVLGIQMTTKTKRAGKNIFVTAQALVSLEQSGAIVTGRWSGDVSDIDVATSDSTGETIVVSDQAKDSGGEMTFTFTIESIEINGVLYQPSGVTSETISN